LRPRVELTTECPAGKYLKVESLPMKQMNGLLLIGVVFVVVGILGLAIPMFTTQKTDTVARIGDLKLQSTEDTSRHIPPLLSGGVLVLGMVLIGAGLYQKR
jgi:uncharacterized membrane protein HdeD (DUF308 family)